MAVFYTSGGVDCNAGLREPCPVKARTCLENPSFAKDITVCDTVTVYSKVNSKTKPSWQQRAGWGVRHAVLRSHFATSSLRLPLRPQFATLKPPPRPA